MSRMTYESFTGFSLFEGKKTPQDHGVICKARYGPDGVVTFTTETGEHSYFYKGRKPAIERDDGTWEFPARGGRKGYVRPRSSSC